METQVKMGISNLTLDQLATLRNKLSATIKGLDDQASEVKKKREKVDVEFLRRFNEQGLRNVRTAHGNVHIIERESVTTGSKEDFMGWVKSTDQWDFLEVRPSKAMVLAYMQEHEDIPPGLNYSKAATIGVTK